MEQYRALDYVREHTEHTAHSWQQKQLVLLKEAGTWRIQFFHSTRVPVK